MKRFLLLTLFIAIISSIIILPKPKVLAEEGGYMRVLQNGAIIYHDASLEDPIFEVPLSYYVKVESRLGNSVKVSYGDGSKDCPVIIGYMDISLLTEIDYEPTSPFFIIKISTDVSDILFNDVELKTPYFNVPKNEVMYYLGEINSGDKVLCYVYYSKKLGYVDKTCFNPFTITPNPDKVEDELPKNPTVNEETNNGDSAPSFHLGENLQLLIIIGISVVSISVVYFLFKPQKNKTGDEQNEFSTD